ncbi:MAG: hypothetical protein E7455_09725 [Ruminococcaceae bacterium]|nr:hypothetical protein [Oscillospiraceae bacterium]
MKKSNRALLSSVLALVLCCSMLIGSTFAWFTDSAASGSNVITSGNLDIEVEYTLDGKTWADLDGAKDLFSKGLWEPGHTEVVALRITNKGSLALKYSAHMNIFTETVGQTKDGEEIKLSEILSVSSLVQATGMVGDIAVSLAFAGENKVAYETTSAFESANVLRADQHLIPGDAHYVVIKVDMPESVGNEANHDGVHVPSINFGVNVMAAQLTHESDSFDNQYDKDVSVSTFEEMKNALAAGVTDFDFMGNTVNLNYGLTKAMIPAGTTVTIKNAMISGRSYGNGVDGTVIFENCTFTHSGAYSIHFDNGAGEVIFKNCTLYGWNSFGSTLKSVSFYNCALYGNGKYALIRSYVDLYLENCTYDTTNADHEDVYNEGIEAVNGAKLEMVDCAKSVASGEAFIEATEGGNLAITEDIVYNNTDPNKQMILEATGEINFNGNGNTITVTGADPSIGNHGYVGFVPPAGEDATVSDVTITGTGFVEIGHYGMGGGNYTANNLKVENLESTLANGDKGFTLGCAFMAFGDLDLNNCVMTGTTAMDGVLAVDLGCGQNLTTNINGGKYGTVYCWSHSIVNANGADIDTLYVAPIKGTVTIKSGTQVDTLRVAYGTSAASAARLAKLTIEDGAEIGKIVFSDANNAEQTFDTVADWNAFVASFNP